ncbi:MAG: hypothetical protein FWG13_02265 [Leptospirales bacterium]|nr:hypothetical protein [Leptospirales bacterium]
MSTDYIPAKDADFDAWFRNLVEYVESKTDKDNPEWPRIPSEDVAKLRAAYEAWHEAYLLTQGPHSSDLTHEKNRVRKESEKIVRDFVKEHLHFKPVTDIDRDRMGIPNHKQTRTDHIDVHEVVEFELVLRNIREILVRFWIKGATHRAKPDGYDGAVIKWEVRDTPPADPEELAHHAMASRTPHTLEFNESERGKKV